MKDISWLKNSYIAHRGLHTKDGRIPENSILAFDKAIEKNYAIELDVNILKDGTVVCFHDFHLKRMCHIDQKLEDLTYKDIQDLHLLDTDQKIPTLKEVLNHIQGKVPLLIELKPHGHVVLLCEKTMEILKEYHGVFAIFSFHPRVVFWMKRHYPQIPRGQIAESFKDNPKMGRVSRFMMRRMIFNPLTKPDFISYGIRDLPYKKLDRLKSKGITIISYAASKQEDIDFVKLYYDNIVFEYFEPLKKG